MAISSAQFTTDACTILNITGLSSDMLKRCHTVNQKVRRVLPILLNYKELQEKVARILEKLPERCGKIFAMSRFEGLKYSEIAEKLSVSIKTVEANMGRALKEFRNELTI